MTGAADDPRARRCKAVRSPRGALETTIEWGDGHVGTYPHEILRGYCPCAGCQGHEAAIRFVPPGPGQLEIERIEPVGNYALRIEWFDGHGSGLYSYAYLRALCFCAECRPGESRGERGPRPRL